MCGHALSMLARDYGPFTPLSDFADLSSLIVNSRIPLTTGNCVYMGSCIYSMFYSIGYMAPQVCSNGKISDFFSSLPATNYRW